MGSHYAKSEWIYICTSREAAADACGLPLFNSRLQHEFSFPLSHLFNKRRFNSLLEEKKATQHWYICFLHTTMRLFLVLYFVQMKWFSLTIALSWHLYVSKHATLPFRMFWKRHVFWIWIAQKHVLNERELVLLLNGSRSCSMVLGATYA